MLYHMICCLHHMVFDIETVMNYSHKIYKCPLNKHIWVSARDKKELNVALISEITTTIIEIKKKTQYLHKCWCLLKYYVCLWEKYDF